MYEFERCIIWSIANSFPHDELEFKNKCIHVCKGVFVDEWLNVTNICLILNQFKLYICLILEEIANFIYYPNIV